MTEAKQVQPFWVVFSPDGWGQYFGHDKDKAIYCFLWQNQYQSGVRAQASWEEYEALGYRCLQCVVKEGE